MNRGFSGILASLVIVVSGCAAPAATSAPSVVAGAGSTVAPAATRGPISIAGVPLAPCTVADQPARCGTLSVLEDRTNPSGRRIDVRVAVIPAVADVPKADPLFAIDGGPSQAATEDLGWTATAFSRLHADRDIVLVDQRGTGGSNRMVAPEAPDTTGLSEADATAKVRAWRDRVLASLPGDPRFYTTSAAMDDLDEVRTALGYDAVDLFGPSYGATAAQYYLRRHGDHVRAVVLDGGTLVGVPIFERLPASSQHALDVLFRRCAADTACHAAYPDLRAEFAADLALVRAHPVTTAIADPWTGDPIVIDEAAFTGAVHGGLVDWQATGKLPRLIHAAHQGDWQTFAQAIASAMGPKTASSDSLVMTAVILCSEGWARLDPAGTDRAGAGSYLHDVQVRRAETQARSCGLVPAAAVPPDDATPVASEVPVLLILGEADPQNPAANVADAPRLFPNSLTVVVPGQAHTVGHLGCMPSIVEAFMEAGTVDGLDVSCAATGVPLAPFDVAP